MKASSSGSRAEEVRPLTEDEIAGRLRGLEPVQALAVAFRCVLRSLPCMAAGEGRGVIGGFSIEDVWTLDETLHAASRVIVRSVDSRLAEMMAATTSIPSAGGMQQLLGFVDPITAGAATLESIIDLNTALRVPADKDIVVERTAGAIRATSLAFRYLEPSQGGQDPEILMGPAAGLESDLAAVERSQKSALTPLGVLSLFFGSPLWPMGVPAVMARLFATWESMLLERFPHELRPGRTVKGTIDLVKSLWEGEMPLDAMLEPGLRDRLSEITQRKNALPQVLALAPRELATRLAALAARDTKLLPLLASPTRATLEGVAKSHGPALLEDARPEWVAVADPLWLAWYAGALGRVMGGMQATLPVVPTAEPVEAKAKSEPRPTPVVKRAPAKAGTGSRPAGPSSGVHPGDAVTPSKPSRPMPKKK